MNNDEIIRLVLDLVNTQDPAEVARKLDQLKRNVQGVADTYEVLERQVGEYEVAEGKAANAMDEAVRKAVEETQARRALNEVLATTVVTTTDGQGKMGRAILQTSYAVQDFTSQLGNQGLVGALNAVQNNITGILSGMGAGAGLAGVVSVVAVGAGLAYQNWDKLASAFADTRQRLPELKEGFEGLKDTLKDVDHQIEALEDRAKSGGLNLFDENKLAALRGIKLQGERRMADEKLVSGIGENDSKAARAIISAVREALAETGGGNAAARNLAMNMGLSGDESTAVVAGAMRGNLTDLDTLVRNAPTFGAAYSQLNPRTNARRRRVVARQASEDASIIQAADEEEREAARQAAVAKQAADAAARAAKHQADAAARAAAAAARRAPIEAARAGRQAARDQERRRQLAFEDEINARSGGTAPAEAIQQAAKNAINMTRQGMSVNNAIERAMMIQARKMHALEADLEQQRHRFEALARQQARRPVGMRRTFP